MATSGGSRVIGGKPADVMRRLYVHLRGDGRVVLPRGDGLMVIAPHGSRHAATIEFTAWDDPCPSAPTYASSRVGWRIAGVGMAHHRRYASLVDAWLDAADDGGTIRRRSASFGM